MFENLSYLALQQYWWMIISLLGSLLVFMMFVQGGQTLIKQVGKNKLEQSLLVNTIGRKWEITFTILVTFGGAFFASFPLFYSTSFGGAYWIWIILLFSFIVQAVSYEYRTKANNFLGQKTFETFLLINGILATILIGAAVGTFFTGSEFSVEKLRITDINNPVISRWENPYHGLEALINITNISLGLTIFFLARILASMYFINSIENENIILKSKKVLKNNFFPFLVFFLLFVVLILTKEGFTVDPLTKIVSMEKFKYWHNLIQMPIVFTMFILGIIGVLSGIFLTLFKNNRKGIWYSGLGTILTIFSVFMLAAFNNTAYYPSTYDLQSSLTIENSSSSKYTLTAMSYVSLLVPIVLAYIWYAWKSINKKRMDENNLEMDEMKY